MQPILKQMNLVARDLSATIAFYRSLGVDVPDGWTSGGEPHHVEVLMGGDFSLELDSPELTRAYAPAWTDGNVLVFSLPSREAVDTAYGDLTADGHPALLAPIDAFWGARYAIVDDPDGNHVGLMSPVDDDRRSPPPEL